MRTGRHFEVPYGPTVDRALPDISACRPPISRLGFDADQKVTKLVPEIIGAQSE
jgi:hypothetical protein